MLIVILVTLIIKRLLKFFRQKLGERKCLLRQWCIYSPGKGNQTQVMLSLVHEDYQSYYQFLSQSNQNYNSEPQDVTDKS